MSLEESAGTVPQAAGSPRSRGKAVASQLRSRDGADAKALGSDVGSPPVLAASGRGGCMIPTDPPRDMTPPPSSVPPVCAAAAVVAVPHPPRGGRVTSWKARSTRPTASTAHAVAWGGGGAARRPVGDGDGDVAARASVGIVAAATPAAALAASAASVAPAAALAGAVAAVPSTSGSLSPPPPPPPPPVSQSWTSTSASNMCHNGDVAAHTCGRGGGTTGATAAVAAPRGTPSPWVVLGGASRALRAACREDGVRLSGCGEAPMEAEWRTSTSMIPPLWWRRRGGGVVSSSPPSPRPRLQSSPPPWSQPPSKATCVPPPSGDGRNI